ncbi:hypothetical protein hrd7_05900 [Leptolinea sp. HRD-7]|nr:hypothetical protein hrd7_05900 [Leptolinea sp. HRD-7]
MIPACYAPTVTGDEKAMPSVIPVGAKHPGGNNGAVFALPKREGLGRVVPVTNDSVPYDEQPACGLKRFQLRPVGKAGGGVTVFHP